MDKMDTLLQELRDAKNWNHILLAAHNADVAMGTFGQPLEESMRGITHGEWQLERAKRIAIAVLGASRNP